ncbi:hypothetical protein IAD21_00955 [Abditibacteriota bacterium]|nr:hypothetical protein IAD21_00955 [Abditibacteriota bacterium]
MSTAIFKNPKISAKKADNGPGPQIPIRSDEELNQFAKGLTKRDRQTAVICIQAELVRLGQPATARVGGALWNDARANVLSGFIQFDTDLGEVRAEMEGSGMEFKKETMSSEGVYLSDE